MPSLVELATQLVTAQASTVAMTTDYIVSSLNRIHTTLEELERSQSKPIEVPAEVQPSLKDAFKENEIVCLLCGKAFAYLGTHLSTKHDMTGDEYRKQFGIPFYQPLIATSQYVKRKKASMEKSHQMREQAEADAKLVAPPIPAKALAPKAVAPPLPAKVVAAPQHPAKVAAPPPPASVVAPPTPAAAEVTVTRKGRPRKVADVVSRP
jgi:predicted transcriptional regulator